jgi:Ran GTPase-activating protein 1
LDLSDNAFGPNGARHILEYLSNVTTLEVLKLHNNGLGSGGAAIISEALTKSAKKCEEGSGSKLRVFICGRNRLENGAENIAAALSLHPQMEEIVIPQNGIRPIHIAKVVKTLTACTKLQVLDLEDNTLDEEGGCALAESLKSWPQLKVLNIGDCYLCKTGGQAVISALTSGFESLEKINLVYNEMGTAEAALIPDMLRNKVNLKSIQLNGNEFEEDGPEANAIRRVLLDLDKEDALDELDDMQVDEEDEETADEESEDEPPAVKAKPEVDDLTAGMKNVNITENDDEDQTEGEDSPTSIHKLQKGTKFVQHNIREDSTLGQLNEFCSVRVLEEDQTDKTWLERTMDHFE